VYNALADITLLNPHLFFILALVVFLIVLSPRTETEIELNGNTTLLGYEGNVRALKNTVQRTGK
jgi:hypothetical protein